MEEFNSQDQNSYFCKIRATYRKISISYLLRRNRCCQAELLTEWIEKKNSKNPDIPEAISLKYPHITPIFVEKQDVT